VNDDTKQQIIGQLLNKNKNKYPEIIMICIIVIIIQLIQLSNKVNNIFMEQERRTGLVYHYETNQVKKPHDR